MKIGILTLPLHSNYGGILQAWALQSILREMRHEVVIIDRDYATPTGNNKTLWYKVASQIKKQFLILIGRRKRFLKPSSELVQYSEQNLNHFYSDHLDTSPKFRNNNDFLLYVNQNHFDAYIVGSDQVWRPKYSPDLMTYFLDFLQKDNKTKKIVYAASFGVDKWELSKEETDKAKRLAPLFNLITVREASGVGLVRHYLNCNSTHVVDPTLLKKKEDYINLIEQSSVKLQKSKGELFCYILDDSKEARSFIYTCTKETSYKPFYCKSRSIWNIKKDDNIENCIIPPVEQWLKSFLDAQLVITDSFHGIIFSMIFNKPFWVITNKNRGPARITSLLNQFNLEHRILSDTTCVNYNSPIDWKYINDTMDALSKKSKDILTSSLSK